MMACLRTALVCSVITVQYCALAQDFEDPGITKSERTFLGIHLGCSINELKVVLKNSNNEFKYLRKRKSEENGIISYYFRGNHRLKEAFQTNFSFWEGKLIGIGVLFKGEDSESIYKALYRMVTKKYGSLTDEFVFAGHGAQVIVGQLAIKIEYDANPFSGGTNSIVAGHIDLSEKMYEKKLQDKADRLGDL